MARLRSLWPSRAKAPEIAVIPDPADSAPDVPDRGMLTLRDARISGWFNRDDGELFPGFPVGAEDVVVDVGCGDGGNLNFAALRGARVIGVDIDDEALAAAGDRISPAASSIELHVAPAENVPLPDSTATRVVCTEVLEHVADPADVMAELVRLGQPGALYLITVPDEVGETVQKHVADPSYFQHPNHIRVFSRESFADLVAQAGLEVLDHTTYGFFWTIWWAIFWGAGVELGNDDHPLLIEWNRLWRDLLERPGGEALKLRLDEIAPKTQVIVARKPAPVATDRG